MIPTIPNQERKIQRMVWCNNASTTTDLLIREGQSLCYDSNRLTTEDGTAAADHEACPDRLNVVELPSVSNNWWFAGVSDKRYLVPPGGGPIIINEPGSQCKIALAGTAALTYDSTRLNFLADGPSGYTGLFQRGGFPGRGSAIVMQSVVLGAASAGAAAANSDSVSDNVPVIAAYSAAFTNTTGVIAITGVESSAAVGDTVIVLSGARTTGANTVVTPYVTTVATVDTNAITLATAPALGADGTVSLCIYRGEPTVMAYLETGDESGGIQYNTCTAAPVIASTQIPCGLIYFDGDVNLAGDLTITPAVPVSRQAYWGVYLDAATDANNLLIAATNAIDNITTGAAFASGDIDAAGDLYYFRALNGKWALMAADVA